MKKHIPLLLFCISTLLILSGNKLFAQKQGQARIDSLRNELPASKGDSNKVLLIDALAKEFVYTSTDSTMVYAVQLLNLAQKINWRPGIAIYYTHTAAVYNFKGDYQMALREAKNAVNIAEETGQGHCLASSYANYAVTCRNVGNYSEAIKYFYALQKLCGKMDNQSVQVKTWLCNAYIGLALIYQDQHNYAEALKNYLASLKIALEAGFEVGVSSCYTNMGLIFMEQGRYKEALEYFDLALKINIETDNKTWQAYNYGNMGSTYELLGNYDAALRDFKEEVRISSTVLDKSGMAEGYLGAGNVYTRLKRYAEAEKSLNLGLALSKEAGEVDQIRKAYERLSILDSATGNWKAAFADHSQFIFYRDSMLNKENVQKLTQSQMQYEFDKKDAVAKEEAKLQRNIRNMSFAGMGVLFLFTLVVVRQRNTVRKGKQRSDELLLNILPSETAEELKATGTAKAKDFSEVTVMFTDFRNFSQLSKRMNAQQLVNEINYCYSAFDDIISKYGIEKIKTIGDSYMCAGGLPVPNKTHAFDVVSAAIEMRDFMLEERRKREAEGRIFFEIKIGIHTGPVVAGIVGIRKFAYDIWGDTVNVASRMESADEAGKINISEATYELVKDKFSCTYRGKIAAKNMGEIDMYFVERIL